MVAGAPGPVLRIFSYLPNPRVWKATIAARLCGVTVELRGAPPAELPGWRWDFDARPLTAEESLTVVGATVGTTGFKGAALQKTPEFLRAHPFGTVPAAFSADGEVGIFESNSIMRAVARLGMPGTTIYGRDALEASRIDSYLDATLVLARDTQRYLLSLMDEAPDAALQARAREALLAYLAGIERALAPPSSHLVADRLSLADICYAVELVMVRIERRSLRTLAASGLGEILDGETAARFPLAMAHWARLCRHAAFAPDIEPYLAKLDSAAASALLPDAVSQGAAQ